MIKYEVNKNEVREFVVASEKKRGERERERKDVVVKRRTKERGKRWQRKKIKGNETRKSGRVYEKVK